jgi:hypothetical protein
VHLPDVLVGQFVYLEVEERKALEQVVVEYEVETENPLTASLLSGMGHLLRAEKPRFQIGPAQSRMPTSFPVAAAL